MNTLSMILSSCQRKTSWGLVDDPIAQDILKSPDLQQLEESLKELLPILKPLSYGTFHLVLCADENIVRLGLGTLQDRPNITEILQPIKQEQIGTLKYEIMPKADTKNVNKKHLDFILDQLEDKDYYWGDAGLDNIGLIDNKPVIIDSEGVINLKKTQAFKMK